MNSKELFQHQIGTYNKCLKIFKAKNADYAASEEDPFRTFKLSEYMGLCSVEEEILTRVAEKLMRVCNVLARGAANVQDEDIGQTLRDEIVYLAILLAYLDSKKE